MDGPETVMTVLFTFLSEEFSLVISVENALYLKIGLC